MPSDDTTSPRVRRPNNSGTVFYSNYEQKWRARLTLPDGRARVFRADTREEVEAKLNALLDELIEQQEAEAYAAAARQARPHKRPHGTGSLYYAPSAGRWKAAFTTKRGKRKVVTGLSMEIVEAKLQAAIARYGISTKVMPAPKPPRLRKPISTRTRFLVLERDRFRCRLCGRSASDGVKLHIDHVRALSNRGTNDLPNLWTLCQDCNLGKASRW